MAKKYCLDANVLIQAWQRYYSPKFCPIIGKYLMNLVNKEEFLFRKWYTKKLLELKTTYQNGLRKVKFRSDQMKLLAVT